MRFRRIGLAQINTTVGDLAGNATRIRESLGAARAAGCDIVAFPELAVTGYPPEDLVLKRDFCEASRNAVSALAAATQGLVAVVGFVDWRDGDARNSAAVLVDGRWVDTYDKRRLPNYGVFDEERYFAPGRRVPVYRHRGITFGVSICEDIWYPGLPLDAMALGGAELCININASPYHRAKGAERARMLATRAADNLIAVAYVNQVGGQDELVFDGASVAFDASGALVARAAQFSEELLVFDIDLDEVAQRRLHDPRRRVELRDRDPWPEIDRVTIEGAAPVETTPRPILAPVALAMDPREEVWRALVLATGDYMRKSGFTRAHIAVSGGIDSSVVAAVAADAVGGENVIGVSMPSRYSSEHSKDDARELARRLGMPYLTIPIEPAHSAMLEMLAGAFQGTEPGTAEENLQARQRGNVLMTLSNKLGSIVLTTGNKSEMATGYATLYGDMAGGYSVLKDVPKTLVYEIARWRNAQPGGPVIPDSVLEKPPSAELRPDQLDQDSLPPYDVLDPILEAYVEDDDTADEIIARGYDEATVRRVIGMVDRNEYKRRQAAPGVKITPRAFGRDRRYPLASKWRG
jgi:NAD+ synthase (glutamine-hydrolysing)